MLSKRDLWSSVATRPWFPGVALVVMARVLVLSPRQSCRDLLAKCTWASLRAASMLFLWAPPGWLHPATEPDCTRKKRRRAPRVPGHEKDWLSWVHKGSVVQSVWSGWGQAGIAQSTSGRVVAAHDSGFDTKNCGALGMSHLFSFSFLICWSSFGPFRSSVLKSVFVDYRGWNRQVRIYV